MSKKRNKGPITHGCYQDLARVDGRTREGKFFARYQAQLLSNLGVSDDPSIQQATIARTAAFKALRIFMAEQHMLAHNGDLPERLNQGLSSLIALITKRPGPIGDQA